MKKALLLPLQISLCIVGSLWATGSNVQAEARPALGEETSPSFLAQVTTDGTVNTIVTPNGNVAEITGGETRDSNLFHSFQEFSVSTGNEAFFNNANDISNIFSRVTGGNISNIDGLIRANGSASLFLINPAGIIFGENASLSLGGSFYGSSASSILFENGEFSATDLDNPPLLTVNAPIGLGFRDNPGDIVNRSTFNNTGLAVNEGQNISLIGGNITIENGGIVFAPGGKIELGGLLEAGTIDIAEDNSLSFPDSVIRSNVSLTDSAIVSVLSSGGGSIGINAANLEIINGSRFVSSIRAETGSPNAQAGDIVIDATDSVLIDGQNNSDVSTGVFSNVGSDAVGDGGNIDITTESLTITDRGVLDANTSGQGNAGNIIVNAGDSVAIEGNDANSLGNTSIRAFVSGDMAEGNAGNIELNTGSLTVNSGATLVANGGTQGNGGDVTINATGDVSFANGSFVFVTEIGRGGLFASALQGSGNGGDVNVFTNKLTISDGAIITASNFSSLREENGGAAPGTGQPGNINIEANSINLDTEGRIEAVTQSAIGEGANINLQVAEDITLQNDSFISAQAINQGNGGNLTIETRFIIASPNGNNDILASAQQGQGGNITIDAESLFGIEERPLSDLTNDINASSEVRGLEGTINITTPDTNPVQGTTELPTNVIVPEQTTTQACQANREMAAKNGLTIKGKGGVPPAPDLPLNSHNIFINGEIADSSASISQPIETSQGKIQPARGIKVTKDGRVILTAYPTNNQGDRLTDGSINCDRV